MIRFVPTVWPGDVERLMVRAMGPWVPPPNTSAVSKYCTSHPTSQSPKGLTQTRHPLPSQVHHTPVRESSLEWEAPLTRRVIFSPPVYIW